MTSFLIHRFQDIFHDVYCFQCHHEGDMITCDSCPRVYHLKCLSVMILPSRNWTCPECEVCLLKMHDRVKGNIFQVTQSSFNIINQRYSIEELYIMLKYTLQHLKSHLQVRLIQSEWVYILLLFFFFFSSDGIIVSINRIRFF